jgi:hypothetical protein
MVLQMGALRVHYGLVLLVLSYQQIIQHTDEIDEKMVPAEGFEPPTP